MENNKNKIYYLSFAALALLLPLVILVVCLIFDGYLPISISMSYYTNAKYVFIILLSFCGVLFILLPSRQRSQRIYTISLGVLCLLIVMFPTNTGTDQSRVGLFNLDPDISAIFHFIFALSFFVGNAFYVFHYVSKMALTRHNTIKWEYILHRINGLLIYIFVIILVVGYLSGLNNYFSFSYLMESLMLLPFSLSMFVEFRRANIVKQN
jgi:hypothetical protein